MDFPLSRAVVKDLVVMPEAGSTNEELASLAARTDLSDLTTIATLNQTAGRGRLDRRWSAPPGQSLAASVLLKPNQSGRRALATEDYGWVPLIAGLAMTRALRSLPDDSSQRVALGALGARLEGNRRVTLKWPNDVLIDNRKVCGILTELLPNSSGIVVGAGLNLTIPEEKLPVPTATSLTLSQLVPEGTFTAEELADLALAAFLTELASLWQAFLASASTAGPSTGRGFGQSTDLDAAGDQSTSRSRAASIHTAVSEACSTLGQRVLISLPDGTHFEGTALELEPDGRLSIRSATDGKQRTVAAGDVTHLRYE